MTEAIGDEYFAVLISQSRCLTMMAHVPAEPSNRVDMLQ